MRSDFTREHSATRAQLTKTKKRVANGVCPCCNRTFKQLARHMKAKHPEFVGAVDAARREVPVRSQGA
jgi:chemotaxis response regulator CheB